MSLPPAGWFPDPEKPGQTRWWDGQQWTDHMAPPAPAVGTLPPPATVAAVTKRQMPVWLWVVLGVVALVGGIFLAPLVAMIALVVMITGVVAMVKDRPTWLRFPSRRFAVIATVVSAVLFFAFGSLTSVLYPSAPEPISAAPTSEPTAATSTPTPSPTVTAFPDDEAAVSAFAGTASTIEDASATTGQAALTVLATLEVKGRSAKTGFDRDEFGQRWLDVDRNGCDTRNDTLARDLTDTELSGPCKVTKGALIDPYTGTHVDFVRGQGTSELVQIDHVVSLSDSWQKGAQQLTPDQRASFANDPLNLLAVSGAANAQKSDGDAATWLPSQKSFRCTFVARQVAVKATYGLWVTQAEHDAIARILNGCPDELVPTSPFAAEPAQPEPAEEAPAPAPEAPAQPAPATAFYANCDAVRAAGASPLYAGQPGYSRKLDRDGDGVACE